MSEDDTGHNGTQTNDSPSHHHPGARTLIQFGVRPSVHVMLYGKQVIKAFD